MRFILAALALTGVFGTTPAVADGNPVVLELFTSQGCSSCPPADALLYDLSMREDVIALALHVDYWDYIGWEDVFGDPAYTARQHAYARAAKAKMVYTPQMVIGGVDFVVGSRPMQVMDLVQAHERNGAGIDVAMARRGDTVQISATPAPRGDYVVQLVRYTPEQTVAIRRGENAGRDLRYANIVTAWHIIARWDGQEPLRLTAQVTGADPIVVIVQHAQNGPIVGAARIR